MSDSDEGRADGGRGKAISLLYDGDGAPRITASGRGRSADEIIALAREHAIPLHENTELVEALIHLPVGEEVPEALYVAVAEVLAFAYLVSGKLPPGYPGGSDENGQDDAQPADAPGLPYWP